MAAFKKLGLSEEILKVIEELGFEQPTEIQKKAIPMLLGGERDFIGLAQTGTGKTAAFGLPLLERVDPYQNDTQALVLAPTRELGKQIAEQLDTFSKYKEHVNVLCVYGGAAISNQIKALRKTQHIIIATPGRLLDLIKRKSIKLNQLEYLVLDEADEMLNMGFKEDIDKILSYCKEEKLTWLFSATMPKEIKKIVKKYMDDPIEVRINAKDKVNVNIAHQYSMVKQSNKTEALLRFLDINPDMRGVVFCRTKRDTQNLAEKLLKKKYRADALHGDLSQHQRDRVMNRFRSNELQVLIATDVAARGIDVNDLTHVFHFTLPDDDSYYTHRSGRTARAGKKGTSIAFIGGRDQHKINRLSRKLDISFEKIEIPDIKDIRQIRVENWIASILDAKAKGLDPDVLAYAEVMFGNLSKDELIAKILKIQLDQLSLGDSKDLNDKEQAGKSRGGGGGRSGSGSRGGSKGGSYKKKKKKYGGSGSKAKSDRESGRGKRGKKEHRKGKNSKNAAKKKKRKGWA